MKPEKSIMISEENIISKIINSIKNFCFGEKKRKQQIQKTIEKLKMENEYLNNIDSDNKLFQASVMTNNRRIAALNYMKTIKKSKKKNNKIVIE